MAKHTFTLFLLKDNISSVEDIFTNNAVERITSGRVAISRNPDYAEDATLYVFQNEPRPPRWLSQISHSFNIRPDVRNQSASAVLTLRISGKLFAVTFGYAWMYLEPTAFIADFGLKVALNSVDDRKLRRLDIANLGEAIKGVTQSASQRHFDTFGVDEALELVRKLSGEVRDDELGSSVTGSNSLKINSEMSFDEIPELAEQALSNFQSNNYRNTSFRVIDKIQPELDSTRIVALDELAARSIAEGKSEFELGLPEISVSDFSSFNFAGFRHRNSYPDLQLTHYTSLLGAQLSALDSSALKRHRVRAEHLNNESIYSTLRVYDALIGSLEMDGARYAINEGKWYKMDSAFKESLNNAIFAVSRGRGGLDLKRDDIPGRPGVAFVAGCGAKGRYPRRSAAFPAAPPAAGGLLPSHCVA